MTFILLDNTKDKNEGPHGFSWLFENPFEIIKADTPEEVLPALAKLEAANNNGHYTAGFCAFELAYALEPCLIPLMPQERHVPLLWFGVFDARRKLSADEATSYLKSKAKGDVSVSSLRPEWDLGEYSKRFERTRAAIIAGEVYQLNLTFKTSFECKGDPVALYLQLREQQPVAFGAYIDVPEFKVLSLSPELFIRQNGMQIETRPMKGTAPRASLPQDDKNTAQTLATDTKSQAENLMIVDLMRNDIGRIAELGSVKAHKLFEVETYKTLHQMISTVQAKLKPETGLVELMKALFAPGSVVGAPKIQAMKIIRELESSARGVYCGAIGMMGRDEKVFNVAIRSAVLYPTASGYMGEMGVGSGVVYDSVAQNEYDECLLKAKFFTNPQQPFGLIETMLHDKGRGYVLLERHMVRLSESASYFAIPFNPDTAIQALNTHVKDSDDQYLRVRLELSAKGEISIQSTVLSPDALTQSMRFVIADKPIHSSNVHLYHKTTQRAFLDNPLKEAKEKFSCDEIVFLNERGELTQSSYMNLFLEQADGTYLTPPVSAGLLPGTFRAEFMKTHDVIEQTLYPQDLQTAKTIYLGNSVRGLLKAILFRKSSKMPVNDSIF